MAVPTVARDFARVAAVPGRAHIDLNWPLLVHLALQLLAVTIIALISLVTKVSSTGSGAKRPGISIGNFAATGWQSHCGAARRPHQRLQVSNRLLEHAGGEPG
jgi:hypothetical protein